MQVAPQHNQDMHPTFMRLDSKSASGRRGERPNGNGGGYGELRPDSELTGVFAYDESVADLDGVRQAISEAAADVD